MQPFRLIVQFASHICTVQAHKLTSAFRVDYVILNDHPDLLAKTGVQTAVFFYEITDKSYLHPHVSYLQYSADMHLPNFSFENAVKESIRKQEGVYKQDLHLVPLEQPDLL